MKKVISLLSQAPWPPNLSKWKLRMKRPHKEFCLKIRLRGHVMNQKRYISTFTRPKGHQNEQGGELG